MKFRKCPSKAELLDFFTEAEATGKRAEVLGHVCSCPECGAVLAAIREIQSQEESLLRGLDDLGLSKADGQRLRERAREEIRRLRPRRSFLRIWAPAAGAALALLITVIVLRDGGFLRRDVERTGRPVRISLRQPRGRLSAAAPGFSWTRGEDIVSCRLVIYDRDLRPVFEAIPGAVDRFELPRAAVASMTGGGMYFWKIAATLKDGQTIESDFAKFVLHK